MSSHCLKWLRNIPQTFLRLCPGQFFHRSLILNWMTSFIFFSQLPIFLVSQMKIITFANCGIRLGLPLFSIHFPSSCRVWLQELQFLPTFPAIHQAGLGKEQTCSSCSPELRWRGFVSLEVDLKYLIRIILKFQITSLFLVLISHLTEITGWQSFDALWASNVT